MADPYTWLESDGKITIRTEDSYAAYVNEDGMVEVRPAVGIVEYDEDGMVLIWVPVQIDAPEQPAISAEASAQIESLVEVFQEIGSQATHDNEIEGEATVFEEIGGEATFVPGE